VPAPYTNKPTHPSPTPSPNHHRQRNPFSQYHRISFNFFQVGTGPWFFTLHPRTSCNVRYYYQFPAWIPRSAAVAPGVTRCARGPVVLSDIFYCLQDSFVDVSIPALLVRKAFLSKQPTLTTKHEEKLPSNKE
jgi:hypothetical protein